MSREFKIIALSFADENFKRTQDRYSEQMMRSGIFDKVITYSPSDFDSQFLEKNGDFIRRNKKGYGCWIWKPYFIRRTFEDIQHGDVVVYGDSGNELSGNNNLFLDKIMQVKNLSHLKLFASKNSWILRWTKSDLLLKNFPLYLPYLLKRMVEPGRLIIEKNYETIEFVNEWESLCNVHHLIDDSPSKIPNNPFFIEHRHDQSIFSLLFHKYRGTLTNFDNFWKASRLR